MRSFRFTLLASLMVAAGAFSGHAVGAEGAAREDLLTFQTSARLEVTQDLLGITLSVTREGSDPQAVQAQLKQVLDAALADARRAAQPGAMEVRTGNFSLYPRHGKDGRITAWQGQAGLVLEGKDTQRVAATAGRLAGMNVTGVGYRVSPELVQVHEAGVTAEAIQQYRARAAELARQFGYTGYTLGEVSVHSHQQDDGPKPVMYRAEKADMAMAESPVPSEPGKGVISATVSGSIRLIK